MPDLNEQIRKLRSEGKSYREIGSILGISHVAVMKRMKKGGNQVVTQKTPSLSPAKGVNPSGIASGKLSEFKKGVFREVLSEGDDLFAAIKEFLEIHGVELYQIQVSGEAYQVTNGTQVIRFYLSHINKDDMKRYSENFKE